MTDLPEFLQLFQLGATGAMLVMVWRLLLVKDGKSYDAAKEHVDDIKKLNDSTRELVAEVTAALVSKNHTDEQMSAAVDKLAEQIRQLKEVLRERR